MTTDPTAPPPPNVAALVDAIDARARQAGNEGATAVMQRMLGSVTDVLASIQDRLDHLEDAVSAGGGGGGGVADAVQAGLAAFNARLGRLEEAFVQAVDESGSGTQAVVDEVHTAVVRALEATAPGSGLDPETREALARVESALAGLAGARDERPAAEAVGLALAAVGERLDLLEQRLVAAVPPPPTPVAPAVDLSPFLERLGEIERRMVEGPRDQTASIEVAFQLVQARLAELDQLVRGRATERVDTSALVRSAMAPVVERIEELDAAQRATAARQQDGIGRLEGALAAMPGRLTSLEERVWAVVSSLTEGASSPIDASVVARIEEAVDRLDRDEASARLVKLVEERLSAGLRAVTERSDEARRAVERLAASVAASTPSPTPPDDGVLDDVVASVRALQAATHDVPDEVATALGARLAPLGDRLTGLDVRLDALADLVARAAPTVPDHSAVLADLTRSLADVRASLAELSGRPVPESAVVPDHGAAIAEVRSALPGLVEQVNGAVRREAELLTQRVAALAVGVEASRVLLEQHVQETEGSIGRKAGEVTRRLAADLGLKSRRGGPRGRRDPRELGSG